MVALAVIGFNWSTFWRERSGGRQVPSPVPFFGGLLALLAMLLAPLPSIRVWCWVPLLIDWGSIPAIVFRQR